MSSAPEPFEIEGSDGGPLRGDWYDATVAADSGAGGAPGPPHAPRDAPARVVVLCHGFRGYKDWGFIPLLARRLSAEGLAAAAFNFSGSGIADPGGAFSEPERFRRNTYGRELEDLGRVADWIARRATGATALGIVGHSRGGALALLYAAQDHRVRCIATLASPSRIGVWRPEQTAAWERGEDASIHDFRTRSRLRIAPDLMREFHERPDRFDVGRAVESLAVPLLIVHGSRDRAVPIEEARALAARAPSLTTELRVIDGAGHTFQAGDAIRRTPAPLLDMVEAVGAWMRRWLGRA